MIIEKDIDVCWKCRKDTDNQFGDYYVKKIDNLNVAVFICHRCAKKENIINNRVEIFIKKMFGCGVD
jgi:hypothetical protein